MRKSPRADHSIFLTASCGGLYPSYYSPIYTATEHGVVGFIRSIASWYFHKFDIRVNAFCTGVVKTNLLSAAEWGNFPERYFTPVDKIARTVGVLVDGKGDGSGVVIGEGEGVAGVRNGDGDRGRAKVLYGKTVDISGEMYYFREGVGFADEAMRVVVGATNIESLENAKTG